MYSKYSATYNGESSARSPVWRSPHPNPSPSRNGYNRNASVVPTSNYGDRRMNDRRTPTKNGHHLDGLDDLDGKIADLSMAEEVKLHESENAWRPRFLKRRGECDEASKKTDELLKKFRSVLNKLTPDNFSVLIEQVKNLDIDTDDRLDGCIKILFEKAIREANFTDTYAKMCSVLGTIISAGTNGQRTNFKRKLITQCELEFKKHHSEAKQSSSPSAESKTNGEMDQIDGKDELQYALEDKQTKIRRRALGTVRFIGELYKQEQLTCKIMYGCINILLDEDMLEEESLECLCKLLTTIGARMEKDPVQGPQGMKQCFLRLQEIADRKSTLRVCNRIRFLIIDLIELRANNWQPRRVQAAPKTMNEIQKEVEMEENKNRILNFVLPEHGHGGYSRQGGERSYGGDGGSTSRNSSRFPRNDGFMRPPARPLPSFDVKRLNVSNKSAEAMSLGSAAMFRGWGNNSGSLSSNDFAQQRMPPPSYFGSGGSGGGYGGGHSGSGSSYNDGASASGGGGRGGYGGGNKRSDGGSGGNQRRFYNGRKSQVLD
ncbi:eukaryotic translation initiation factor 4 gamma 1-like [Toxorhynchites rutilus septentrionalis]|uniref:eukaryotic translation initiation factor 4 gamma 1-like n=1 Tax=Toxorhynchites rutilus septentrionalis TaxID=329112 RepID=UPI002478D33B|nr:eukaryotic translation initiation factor 4 gamma 1-like [Toxorhynchites rutilus septentrionalis]